MLRFIGRIRISLALLLVQQNKEVFVEPVPVHHEHLLPQKLFRSNLLNGIRPLATQVSQRYLELRCCSHRVAWGQCLALHIRHVTETGAIGLHMKGFIERAEYIEVIAGFGCFWGVLWICSIPNQPAPPPPALIKVSIETQKVIDLMQLPKEWRLGKNGWICLVNEKTGISIIPPNAGHDQGGYKYPHARVISWPDRNPLIIFSDDDLIVIAKEYQSLRKRVEANYLHAHAKVETNMDNCRWIDIVDLMELEKAQKDQWDVLQKAQKEKKADFYSVKIVAVVEKKQNDRQAADGVFVMLVKVDKKIPCDTGKITFDSSVFDIADFQPSIEKRLLENDHIYLYFDTQTAKGKLKVPDDLAVNLPMESKVYLRRFRP